MNNLYLKRIELLDIPESEYFNKIEGLKKFQKIIFNSNVTFFTGENGTGKSTLLEAIAIKLGFNPEGGSKNYIFSTSDTHSNLHEYLRLGKGACSSKDGFFFRAETFYNLATYTEEIELDYDECGGKSLHMQSHGESFINLMSNRFRGKGIYILDEPESALSINRQLSLLALIHDMSKSGSQFIIATHSPVLLSLPNAQIVSLDKDTDLEIVYEDCEPYKAISQFINNRERIFKYLFEEE